MLLLRQLSDHDPIKLMPAKVDWGPRPFRFDNRCLMHKDFIIKSKEWWTELDFNGFASFIL